MNTLNVSDKTLEIGTIFTPFEWGTFAVEQFGIFNKWIGGATIFDPTMGEGNLLISLIEYGIKNGHPINNLPTERLYGAELNTTHYQKIFKSVKEKFGLDLPKKIS